jgi:hypothetical protein
MALRKSPGGSLYPYPYKNGELFGLHFGSFHSDETSLLHLMQAEERFMLETKCRLPMWFDLYETDLSDKLLGELTSMIARLSGRIPKLALVGCSSRDRRRLLKSMKKLGGGATVPIRFYADPEQAKTWLIGED